MGTKLTIWKQGQFYPELGKKEVELPYPVKSGPSDHLVKIEGLDVPPDENGDFLYGDYSEDESDAIHTFGVIRSVIDLYENLCGMPIKWLWQQNGDSEPLKVYIRNNDIHARFLPEMKCIELDVYGKSDALIYNCRTTDLVVHETGHAFFNSIFPDWQNGSPETRGLEEAFCDLSAMFFILSQYDFCEEVIRETRGDLSKPSMLSLFGVGHGHKNNPGCAIRNALNDEKYNKNSLDPYSFCKVLTGVLYGFLTELYNQNTSEIPQASVLYEVGKRWQSSIMMSFLRCDPNQSSLSEFAQILMEYFPGFKTTLKAHFQNRGIGC